MGHGTTAIARLDSEASARMKRIPVYLLPTVMKIARDAAYEMCDLIQGYHNNVYPPRAGCIEGRYTHRALRKDSWEGSDVHEEIEIAIDEAGEEKGQRKR